MRKIIEASKERESERGVSFDWLEEIQTEKSLGEWIEKKEKKDQLNTRRDDVKTVENYSLHFGVNAAKGFHTHHEGVKTEPVSKHVLELQQKMRKIISRSVSALYPHDGLFSFSLFKAVDSVHTLFLSSRRQLRGVFVNKLSNWLT